MYEQNLTGGIGKRTYRTSSEVVRDDLREQGFNVPGNAIDCLLAVAFSTEQTEAILRAIALVAQHQEGDA